MKNVFAVFVVVGVGISIAAFGFGSKRTAPAPQAPSTQLRPLSEGTIEVQMEAAQGDRVQLTGQGFLIFEDKLEEKKTGNELQTSIQTKLTNQCKIPIALRIDAEDDKAEKAFLADLSAQFKQSKIRGTKEKQEGMTLSLRSNLLRIEGGQLKMLGIGSLEAINGVYRLESVPALKTQMPNQSTAFVNDRGMAFILPAQHGVGKIKLHVSRTDAASDNLFCQEIERQGFTLRSRN